MNATELHTNRRRILENIGDAGRLADIASVLIKFVYHLSPESYFEHANSVASEWILRPKSWITFYLTRGRSGLSPKITLSLDHWPQNLDGVTTLEIRQGRKPQWSKVTIRDIAEIEEALKVIRYVSPRS